MILLKLRFVFLATCLFAIVSPQKETNQHQMHAWQVHKYHEHPQISAIKIPVFRGAHDLLIKVEAASVNVIDVYMQDGYGRNLLRILRNFQNELPLTLGRDFSGTVVKKGYSVKRFNIGDKVYGFVPLEKPGTFAEYVVAEDQYVQHKPAHLSESEAASLVYTSMTAYGALYGAGNVGQIINKRKHPRVLILGASGGVGNAATQLMASQNVSVTGTCSGDAIPLVHALGAEKVFDYHDPHYSERIAAEPKFDIILDCTKLGIEHIPREWKYRTYISLNAPLAADTDNDGVVMGLVNSSMKLIQKNLELAMSGKSYRWGFFIPSSLGFSFIHDLIEHGKMRPIIHREFSFNEVPQAMQEVAKGHLRGKVVVNLNHKTY